LTGFFSSVGFSAVADATTDMFAIVSMIRGPDQGRKAASSQRSVAGVLKRSRVTAWLAGLCVRRSFGVIWRLECLESRG
jgi:hypothetical protein